MQSYGRVTEVRAHYPTLTAPSAALGVDTVTTHIWSSIYHTDHNIPGSPYNVSWIIMKYIINKTYAIEIDKNFGSIRFKIHCNSLVTKGVISVFFLNSFCYFTKSIIYNNDSSTTVHTCTANNLNLTMSPVIAFMSLWLDTLVSGTS